MPRSARPATDSATADAIIDAWRAESARLVGALARMTRDLDLAEDLAQDALVAALEQWPASGIPDKPAAWLMTTAKRRGIDEFRRAETRRRKTAELGHGWEERSMPDLDSQLDYIEDDVLRLIFSCCHPSLTPESRAALTLRLVGGLTTAEIARAFLTSESTMGQRISRAKKTLAESGADFELPTGKERTARLDDVMAVIYLIFNEGYTATAGADWLRPELTTEALRLASMLTDLMPDEPETHGLLSLVAFQASRNQARIDQAGRPILLEDQDRSRWDAVLIQRGLSALERAEALAARGRPVGRYYLQAAIASRHAQARTAAETDWRSIATLYDVLAEAAPGPVVEVNRAVAYGRAFGPEAGLAVLAELPTGTLAGSHLLPSVRGDLLARAGRHLEAAVEFRAAAALTKNAGEQAVLLQRATALGQGAQPAVDATATIAVPWTSDATDPATRSAIAAVIDQVQAGHGLTVTDWELLGGEHDLNLEITTGDQTTLLAKLTAATADDPDWAWRLGLLDHLHQAGFTLSPELHRPSSGRPGIAVELGASVHQLILTSWLPGQRLADLDRHSPALLTDLGRVVGELTAALVDAPAAPPALQRHRWDTTEAAATIRAHLPAVTEPEKRCLAETMAERFDRYAAPRLDLLPWQITHHDVNDFNVLAARGADGTRISGVVDIADALPAPRVCELAVAAAYAMLRKSDPLAALATVVAGYCHTQALTEDEIETLYPLAGARLALNATVWAHRVARTGTDYGARRAQHTWATLQQLATIPAAVAAGVVRAAAGQPPRPARPAPAASAAVLDGLRPVEVDLSVTSPLFDHLDLPAAPGPAAEPTASAVAAAAQAAAAQTSAGEDAVPVGAPLTSRFTRLARRNDHHGEPATIHLGRDLYLPLGTAIHSPVPGSAQVRPDGTVVVQHEADHVGVWVRWTGLKPLVGHGPIQAGQLLGTVTATPVRIAVFSDEESASLASLDFVLASQVAGWTEASPDPAPLLGLPLDPSADTSWTVARVLATREEHFGRSQRHYYDAPMNLVRGRDAWLYDENGLGYIDPINNVSHVGHGNPRVAEAAHRQLRRLNTNSRLVYDAVARYAERLTSLLPDPLEVVFLVCTGSEANDLAVRIARQVTGRQHMVVLDGAYHGNTAAVTGISPNRYRGPGGSGPPPTTREAPTPDRYRGPYGYDDPAAGSRYAADLARVVSTMSAEGAPPAALIAESLMGTAGTIIHPPQFLASAAAAVRAAGGLVVLDEVQVGFGRTGESFWAFEPHGVVPDIVTMGKPMGNGHPLAAVVTTRAIADAFDNGMKYFNTFGGNPVSCEIGLAVLDEIEQRHLQTRAAELGARFAVGLRRLADHHELIGDVRGRGLYLGVDLVTDRTTKQPAATAARQISERLKDLGVLCYPTGIHDNVLKLKPPLVIDQTQIDAFVTTLDDVLGEF